MNPKDKFIARKKVYNPYSQVSKTVAMKHILPISIKFLKNNPEYLEEFEKDWEELNNVNSERFSNWLETASPIALENYRVFSEYKNRKPTILDKLGKFIHGLNDFFETPFGGFIAKIFGAAFISVTFVGGFSIVLALVCLLGFIGVKLFAVNPILSIGYAAFITIFIPTLLHSFDG